MESPDGAFGLGRRRFSAPLLMGILASATFVVLDEHVGGCLMRSSVQLLLTTVVAGLVVASCGGGSSPPAVRNYQSASGKSVVTPQSLCAREGLGYDCSGKDTEPCGFASQTNVNEPADTGRATIGVGEQVTITTNGSSLNISGGGTDGTLNGSSYQATLTAGAVAGDVTVSTPGKDGVCLANSITFYVIAPSAAIYTNEDTSVYHNQGFADIGIYSLISLAPATVNFYNVTYEEAAPAYYSANGTWACVAGTPDPGAGNPIAATDIVGSQGTEAAVDHDYSYWCPGNQDQTSSETLNEQTQYSTGGSGWNPIDIVTSSATATTSGVLNITKSQTTGTTTVTSATSPY